MSIESKLPELDLEIKNAIRMSLSEPDKEKFFDRLMMYFETYYNKPAHGLAELKRRTTKTKGDLFEVFALRYLQALGKYKNVWLLHQAPKSVLTLLGLCGFDVGIDLIVEEYSGEYSAVQAKYRKLCKSNNGKRQQLSWAVMATFFALVSRCGPFHKYVVFTNTKGVRKFGHGCEKDYTMARGTLINTDRSVWLKMLDTDGGESLLEKEDKEESEEKYTVAVKPVIEAKKRKVVAAAAAPTRTQLSAQELRAHRAAFFDKSLI
jgi:hypothetical protein